jgi:hypothetical protein
LITGNLDFILPPHILGKGSERFPEGVKKVKWCLVHQAQRDARATPRYANQMITGLPGFIFKKRKQDDTDSICMKQQEFS